MNAYKTYIPLGVILAIVATGCQIVDEPIEIDNLPSVRVKTMDEPVLVADQTDPAIGNRFTSPGEEPAGAVEDALAWSKKYEELLAKNETITESNHALLTENSNLKQKLEKLQTELDSTRAELEDANRFLQELHQELTRWKMDVLGFREEMRSAQAAQLQALAKILQILGAEPMPPPVPTTASGSPTEGTTTGGQPAAKPVAPEH